MHLVALVESEDHVCCRYRLAAFRPHLAAAGHTLELRPLPRSWLGRLTLGRDLRHADAVILQRKLLPPLAVALLRRRVRRLIFDFDDALWLRDSYSGKGFDDPRRAARFRAAVRACDVVVAGNEYLAAEARRWTNPARVAVIPTCVDVTRYPLRDRPTEARVPLTSPLVGEVAAERSDAAGGGVEHKTPPTRLTPFAGLPHKGGGGAIGQAAGINAGPCQPPPLRLVWVGSSSTLRGLERFAPTLSAIGRAVPGVRLKLVCDRFISVPDLPVERVAWDEATEPAEVASADVGIGWVPDDPWSRGKCGLKVLQYQAAGLPVVANPVGVQAEMVRHGETGLLATTPDEWVGAIKRLTADPDLRRRLGSAGRRQVEARYGVVAGAARWVAALEGLAIRQAG